MSILKAKDISLLKGKSFAHIATLNRDGSPHVTPVWVDTDGTKIMVNTAIGRVKERNLARDPRVALSLFDENDPYSWISLDGKVVEKITGAHADNHINYLSMRYTGQKFQGSPDEKRIILVIEPTRIRRKM
jgi:PPOX class probable F420-dependent enzyme